MKNQQINVFATGLSISFCIVSDANPVQYWPDLDLYPAPSKNRISQEDPNPTGNGYVFITVSSLLGLKSAVLMGQINKIFDLHFFS